MLSKIINEQYSVIRWLPFGAVFKREVKKVFKPSGAFKAARVFKRKYAKMHSIPPGF